MREFYFVLFESCVNKGKNDFIRKFFWKSVLDVICDLLKKIWLFKNCNFKYCSVIDIILSI